MPSLVDLIEKTIAAVLAEGPEQRKEFILKQLGAKLQQRGLADPQIGHFLEDEWEPGDIVDLILAADPTRDKKYSPWLARMYANNKMRLDDLGKATEYLTIFDRPAVRNALDPSQRDINRYQSLQQLYDVVSDHEETESHGEMDRREEDEIKREIDVVYKGNDGMVYVPKTERASCYLGRGTQWCTASTQSHNAFRSYHDDGPLYVWIAKGGEKLQFHLETNQYMDETDSPIDLTDWVKSHPKAAQAILRNTDATKNKLHFVYQIVVKKEAVDLDLTDTDDDGNSYLSMALEVTNTLTNCVIGSVGGNMTDLKIVGCRFSEEIDDADFDGSTVSGCNFEDAVLKSSFDRTVLKGTTFADVSNTSFISSDLSGCDFEDSHLSNVDMSKSTIRGAEFSGAQLGGPGSKKRSSMARSTAFAAKGSIFDGSSFVRTDMRHADLRGSSLRDCDLDRALVDGLDLRGCDLSGTDLSGAIGEPVVDG